MLLNDIGRSPDTTFKKINQHLQTNYGFRIAEDISDRDLVSIMEQIEEEIFDLKLKGEDSKASSEISKRLLILEGMQNLREYTMIKLESPDLERVLGALADFVFKSFRLSGTTHDDFNECLRDAMKHYRSSQYRFPDDLVEDRVKHMALTMISCPEEPSIHSGEGNIYFDEPSITGVNEEKETTMKENLVKDLRRLLESKVSQAEVMMAAKGFSQELQEMIEKIGRLQNEDLPPVTDQMRETYGTESSSSFQTLIYGSFQNVMDSLYTAKSQVDDAVTNMALTGKVSAEIDMDKDVDMGGAEGEEEGLPDLDNLGGEESPDEFGGAEAEEPLGRAKKVESIMHLERKILEMKKLISKAKKLKESKKIS